MISKQLIGLLFYLFLVNQGAGEAPICIPLTESQEPVRIARGAEQCLSIPMPGLREERVILLTWKARIEGDPDRGGYRSLRVRVNDKVVGLEGRDRSPRTTNKPPLYTDPEGRCHAWYTKGNDAWLAPFARGFNLGDLSGMFEGAEEEVFLYSVDISDLIRKSAVNRIVFRNVSENGLAGDIWYRTETCTGDLVLKDILLEMTSPKRDVGSEEITDPESARVPVEEKT